MKIRKAKSSEIKEIKKLVNNDEELNNLEETFSEDYYKRILKKGILIVAVEEEKIVGVCFGTYNVKEKWADLLILVVKEEFRNKGIGTSLVNEFETIAKNKKLNTIDLYAEKNSLHLFNKLKYQQGRTYTAFRKKINCN